MSEYWHLKIIADSEEEVRFVLAEVTALINLEPTKVKIELYPKFPRMWTCEFATPSTIPDPIRKCAERFAKLGTPSWENYWRDSSRPRERDCYEAIADVRRHLFAVDRVFWAKIYCEVRAPRPTSDETVTGSDTPGNLL